MNKNSRNCKDAIETLLIVEFLFQVLIADGYC